MTGLRILQVNNQQLTTGGVAAVMANEAEMLREAGHIVDQLILPADAHPGLAGAVKPTYNRAFCQDLARHMTTFKPDIVHVHTPFPLMSPAVFRTAKKHGAATIATLHSFRYSCIKAVCNRDGQVCEDCIGSRLKLAGVRHRCYHDSFAASAAITLSLVTHHGRTFGECVDRFAALSDYAREVAVRDGLPAAKVVVKPNFVPDPHPDLDPVGESVLFMGRLVPEKGIAHLLDAWVRFRDTLPALVIAGDGAMRSAVEDAIAAGANIDFLGWVEESDLEAHIAKCRIVVVTSLWQESAPMVLLRSLAAARPAVVPALSNFNGPAVALKAAATYTPGDAASLAATVIAMYDAAEHLSLRETARNTYLSTYSPSIIFDSLVQIYRDALAH